VPRPKLTAWIECPHCGGAMTVSLRPRVAEAGKRESAAARIAGYWAAKTPEERSAEIRGRWARRKRLPNPGT
jgi:hypothetical protein